MTKRELLREARHWRTVGRRLELGEAAFASARWGFAWALWGLEPWPSRVRASMGDRYWGHVAVEKIERLSMKWEDWAIAAYWMALECEEEASNATS